MTSVIQPIRSSEVVIRGRHYTMEEYSKSDIQRAADSFKELLDDAMDTIDRNGIPVSLDADSMRQLHELMIAQSKDWRH